MKSEKGITIAILILYVVIFTIVITLLANLSNYIYGNLKYVDNNSIDVSEFNKFNVHFIKDVKTSKNVEVKTEADMIQIIFESGNVYRYIPSEKSIYKNKQKIAKDIQTFSASKLVDTASKKTYIRTQIEIGAKEDTNYTKSIDYVLKYW